MPSDSYIIALSETKKTANEAKNVCASYGGHLSQFDNMESIRPLLIKEYIAKGLWKNYTYNKTNHYF